MHRSQYIQLQLFPTPPQQRRYPETLSPTVPPPPPKTPSKSREGPNHHLATLTSTSKGKDRKLRPILPNPLSVRHRYLLPTSPLRRSIIQALDIVLPLLHIHTIVAPVVRHETIDLALDICRLRVDGARAGVLLNLLLQLDEKLMCPNVPDGFVRC
jgi:hypothetical protein